MSLTNEETVCKCVFRAVFRACYDRFIECSLLRDRGFAHVDGTRGTHATARQLGLKNEEYAADFLLIAKKIAHREEHHIFRYSICWAPTGVSAAANSATWTRVFSTIFATIQHKLGKSFRWNSSLIRCIR